jgi:hypothetical protein
VKVTRIAYSRGVSAGKYGLLVEQAGRLGRVRSLVWDRYGSITGVGVSDRQIRDGWMVDGIARSLGVLANAGKETVRGQLGKAAGPPHQPRHRHKTAAAASVGTAGPRVTYRAAVVDKARVIVAEDLSRTSTGRRNRGADTNRRWAAWTKGITAEALTNVSGRERFCGAAGQRGLHVAGHPRYRFPREAGGGSAVLPASGQGRVARGGRRSETSHPDRH